MPDLSTLEMPFGQAAQAGASPQHNPVQQRAEQLRSIAITYEALAQKWETDELCDLWGDEYADAMAEECWRISMQAQVELLRVAEQLETSSESSTGSD